MHVEVRGTTRGHLLIWGILGYSAGGTSHFLCLCSVPIRTQTDFWPGPVSITPLLLVCGELPHLWARELLCLLRAFRGQMSLLITVLYLLGLISVMKQYGISAILKATPWTF